MAEAAPREITNNDVLGPILCDVPELRKRCLIQELQLRGLRWYIRTADWSDHSQQARRRAPAAGGRAPGRVLCLDRPGGGGVGGR